MTTPVVIRAELHSHRCISHDEKEECNEGLHYLERYDNMVDLLKHHDCIDETSEKAHRALIELRTSHVVAVKKLHDDFL